MFHTFSDFEIECLVSAELWKEHCIKENKWIPAAKRTYKFIQRGECVYKNARYCSNWNDAGFIIEKYGISLVFTDGNAEALYFDSQLKADMFNTENSNPLRAVMICFLKMKANLEQ